MDLHCKYTDYKIIYKDKKTEKLEHIKDSNQTIEIWYFEFGQIKEEIWYLNGKRHREDGPAIIKYYESGQIKNEIWCLNGATHRKDGPAVIEYYTSEQIGYKAWLINNKRHREDGPARIWYNKSDKITSQEFYLNDIGYTYAEFIQTLEYQASLKQQLQDIFD